MVTLKVTVVDTHLGDYSENAQEINSSLGFKLWFNSVL